MGRIVVDQTHVFRLERLYVTIAAGQNGQPTMQELGRTRGILPEQLSECWRMARLMPPLPEQCTEAMPGAFGIFRGESAEYIIAKAQRTVSGAPIFQYLLAPAAVLRAISGNVSYFEPYACEPIQQFPAPRYDLPPFVIEDPEAPDYDTQIASLEAIM